MRIIAQNEEDRAKAERVLLETELKEHPNVTKHVEVIIKSTQYNAEWFDRIKKQALKIAIKYGLSDTAKFFRTKFYLIQPGKISELRESNTEGGFSYPPYNTICVEQTESPVLTELITAHELFHLFGYRAVRWKLGKLDHYRDGVKTRGFDTGTKYFDRMEEALVAELTHIYFQRYIAKDKRFKTHLATAKQLAKHLYPLQVKFVDTAKKRAALHAGYKDLVHYPPICDWEFVQQCLRSDIHPDYKMGLLLPIIGENADRVRVFMRERKPERQQFQRLLRDAGRSGQTTSEELFNAIAYAHFAGNYMRFARIIKKVYGRFGFRQIADAFATR